MGVIAVVGLGSVGLPLAAAFGLQTTTIDFGFSAVKFCCCSNHRDQGGTVSGNPLQAAGHSRFAIDPSNLAEADFTIIALSTRVKAGQQRHFRSHIGNSRDIVRHVKQYGIAVCESTAYQRAAQDILIAVPAQDLGKMEDRFPRRLRT